MHFLTVTIKITRFGISFDSTKFGVIINNSQHIYKRLTANSKCNCFKYSFECAKLDLTPIGF